MSDLNFKLGQNVSFLIFKRGGTKPKYISLKGKIVDKTRYFITIEGERNNRETYRESFMYKDFADKTVVFN